MAMSIGTAMSGFIREFMRNALREYEAQLRRDALVEANVKERLAAAKTAKKFLSFVFGTYRGKGKQPYF